VTGVRDQRGSALVVAIVVMALILTTSLSTMAFIDRSQSRSGTERVKEAAFTVGESLLDSEVLILSDQWPSTAAAALPATCTAAALRCPDPAQTVAAIGSPDVAAGVAWRTTVRDDLGGTATYYSKAETDAAACAGVTPCTWDSNGNGAVWVRAEATVRGRVRTVVGLVRRQLVRVSLPRNTITAGYVTSSNNGNKVIVDEKGCLAKSRPSASCNAVDPGPVVVRCTTSTPATASDACLGYRAGQVAPALTTQAYSSNVLTSSTLLQMKTYAIQLGSYFDAGRGCPTAAQASGALVFIDGLNCAYTGGTINSAAAPGTLVVNAGTLGLGGNTNVYGLVFMANNLPAPQDAGVLLTTSGTAYIQGAVFVEGRGGVRVGSSGLNVSFDPNSISNVLVAGAPSLVQNSFRELPTGL